LRFAVDFYHVTYIRYKYMLVFNSTYDLLWRGKGSSASSVTLSRFHELKKIEKDGARRTDIHRYTTEGDTQDTKVPGIRNYC
jgi:hypothetical protein